MIKYKVFITGWRTRGARGQWPSTFYNFSTGIGFLPYKLILLSFHAPIPKCLPMPLFKITFTFTVDNYMHKKLLSKIVSEIWLFLFSYIHLFVSAPLESQYTLRVPYIHDVICNYNCLPGMLSEATTEVRESMLHNFCIRSS